MRKFRAQACDQEAISKTISEPAFAGLSQPVEMSGYGSRKGREGRKVPVKKFPFATFATATFMKPPYITFCWSPGMSKRSKRITIASPFAGSIHTQGSRIKMICQRGGHRGVPGGACGGLNT